MPETPSGGTEEHAQTFTRDVLATSVAAEVTGAPSIERPMIVGTARLPALSETRR